MHTVKFNKKAIKDYIMPEIKNLKALLNVFHLQKSLKVLTFLDYVLDCELSKITPSEDKRQQKPARK